MCQAGDLLKTLPDGPGVVVPESFANAEHPMRKVTRQVAFDGAWDAERAAKVASLFDGMAPEWAARSSNPDRQASIVDALDRGQVDCGGVWLECGSGAGGNTHLLCDQDRNLVALDLAKEMLVHAPSDLAPRVQGDSSSLPFADDAFDTVLLVNMLLFPQELDRVLSPGGRLLWVNTLGDQTPIHLPVEDVMRAMPGDWTGVTAKAGSGFWLSMERQHR